MFRHASAIAAVILSVPCALAQPASGSSLARIDRKDLCVTNGTVSQLPDGQLAVATPSSRAVVGASTEKASDQAAEIRFRYLGPSQSTKPLASGELRRQIGLKLRAQDTCNLVYAIAVSLNLALHDWHGLLDLCLLEQDVRFCTKNRRVDLVPLACRCCSLLGRTQQ
jgi:hypothetical protein